MSETQQQGAYSIREFCDAHSIHITTFYRWQKMGIGPDELAVGGRRLITYEAVNEWYERMKKLKAMAAESDVRCMCDDLHKLEAT